MAATKKVKVRKLNFKGLIIILLVLYIIGYLGYCLVKMPIKNIVIKGNDNISDNQIIMKAALSDYPSIFTCPNSKIIKKLKEIPLIKNIKVKRNIFGKLTIVVDEYKMLFYNLNTSKVILEGGKEIEDDSLYKGIPTLINYVPDKIYKRLSKYLLRVDENIISLISEIEYAPSKSNEEVIDETRFLLRMNDGNTVYANLLNIKNLNHYEEIYSTLNEEKGYLYLDSSNEENFYFQKYE